MPLTLIEISRAVLAQVGRFDYPSSIAPNPSDATAEKLLYAANRSLERIMRQHDWQIARRTHTFVMQAAPGTGPGREDTFPQPDGLPADIDTVRFGPRIVPDTMWDRTKRWRVQGPLSSRDWQSRMSWWVDGLVYRYWYARGGDLYIYPAVDAGATIAYEYMTRNWVVSSTQAQSDAEIGDKERFTADDDIPLFDEELLTQEMVWRFLMASGEPYGEEKDTSQNAIMQAVSLDGGMPIVRLDKWRLQRIVNIPEGDYGMTP